MDAGCSLDRKLLVANMLLTALLLVAVSSLPTGRAASRIGARPETDRVSLAAPREAPPAPPVACATVPAPAAAPEADHDPDDARPKIAGRHLPFGNRWTTDLLASPLLRDLVRLDATWRAKLTRGAARKGMCQRLDAGLDVVRRLARGSRNDEESRRAGAGADDDRRQDSAAQVSFPASQPGMTCVSPPCPPPPPSGGGRDPEDDGSDSGGGTGARADQSNPVMYYDAGLDPNGGLVPVGLVAPWILDPWTYVLPGTAVTPFPWIVIQ